MLPRVSRVEPMQFNGFYPVSNHFLELFALAGTTNCSLLSEIFYL